MPRVGISNDTKPYNHQDGPELPNHCDGTGKQQELHELMLSSIAETRRLTAELQQQAAAAAAEEAAFQALVSSDPELLAATVKSTLEGRPGPLFLTLQRRVTAQRKAHRVELDQVQRRLQMSVLFYVEEKAAKQKCLDSLQALTEETDSMCGQLKGCQLALLQEQAANTEHGSTVQELEGYVASEKDNSAKAEAKANRLAAVVADLQQRLKEDGSVTRLDLQNQLRAMKESLVEAKDGQKAAEDRLASATREMQDAERSTASLLAGEVDRVQKEASKKLLDTVTPLKKRLAKLEGSAKARVCAPLLGTVL
ncbi:hypothetical protein ABBQ32_000292 [Trebouxia sp. C0010 RCD-2024]